jgi:hypothetical protein
MKRKFLLPLIAVMFAANTGYAQQSDFHYKRKIQSIETRGWFGIPLPSDIFKHINDDYSDLRVLKISNNDTTEIPYLLKVREAVAERESVTLKEINKSKRAGKTYVTFETPKGRTINHAVFNFEEENFDAAITLEGSHDQKQWFTITEKQRIVSLHKNGIQFTSTDVSFPPTNYQFLRATIEGSSITFLSASFEEIKTIKGYDHDVAQQWKVTNHKSKRQTIVDIMFKTIEPVDRLAVTVDQSTDFYRTYSLEVLTDSVKTEKGYLRQYNTLQSGYLTSIRDNDVDFSIAKAQQLRLTIFNEDNAPLKIKTITVSRPEIALVSEFNSGDDLFLFYGNSIIQAPSYDLVHFQDNVPDSLSLLTLDNETAIDHESAEKERPLFQNPVWLWSIMGLMILLLGFFTLRMVKNK